MKPDKDGKVPLSTRVRGSLRDRLQREAEKAGFSLAYLVEQILEDYVKYLDS